MSSRPNTRTSRAAAARDAGLALISRINRWMVAGSVALAALISLVAEHSFHGRTASAATTSSGQSQSSGSSSAGTSNSGEDSIQQPSQGPASTQVPATTPPVAVSGGS